jgi:hypothetical protein
VVLLPTAKVLESDTAGALSEVVIRLRSFELFVRMEFFCQSDLPMRSGMSFGFMYLLQLSRMLSELKGRREQSTVAFERMA